MRKFIRLSVPPVLVDMVNGQERWVRDGERYAANRETSSGFKFSWPVVDGRPINQQILPQLMLQTEDHCSYCDGCYPLDVGDDTIDHFKPKSDVRFYKIVCHWENLYVACNRCQRVKLGQYHDDLLRPDADDYSFDRYFFYDFTTHQIEVKPAPFTSESERRCAEQTRTLLDLNNDKLVTKRQHVYDCFMAMQSPTFAVFDFRYMFDGLI